MAMRSLGYMPNEVELEVIIQRLDMDGEANTQLFGFHCKLQSTRAVCSLFAYKPGLQKAIKPATMMCNCFFSTAGDGQVDFEEFVTLLGPKLTAAGMPDKFNGTDFDSVFWKVCTFHSLTHFLLIKEETHSRVIQTLLVYDFKRKNGFKTVSHLWEDSYLTYCINSPKPNILYEEVWISLRTMSLIKTELISQPLYVRRRFHYLEHQSQFLCKIDINVFTDTSLDPKMFMLTVE